MKVIHYLDKFKPLTGGVQTHIENIIIGMPKMQFEVLTNAIPNMTRDEKIFENAWIRRIGPNDRTIAPFRNTGVSKATFPYRLSSDIVRNRRKMKFLSQKKYDISHIHGPALSMNFLRWDGWLKRPFLSKLMDFTTIKKPKILTMHGLFSPYSDNPVFKIFEKSLIKQFDTIICVDSFINEYIEKTCLEEVKGKRLLFIPNAVDTKKFSYASIKIEDKLKIGYISRVDPIHGLGIIFDLSRNLPKSTELSIVVAGTMKEVNRIKEQFSGLNVTIEINLDSMGVKEFINKMNIILNPIEYQAISRVTLEAMACGRPVIMLDIGNRYPVINEKTGYLVNNKGDIFHLLGGLANDKDEIKRVGKNARDIIEKEFSNEAIMPKMREVYDSVLN